MADTLSTEEVDAELARLEHRAKRRMRIRLPFALIVGGAVAYGLGRLVPTAHTQHTHHAHSTLRTVVAIGIAMLIVGVVALVGWRTRKRWRSLSSWTQPLPAGGLAWRDRRTVYRDIRRGTPHRDPVLRAVEVRSVERLRRFRARWTMWLFPTVAVVLVLEAFVPNRPESARVFYSGFAVLYLFASAAAVRLRLGADRFERNIR